MNWKIGYGTIGLIALLLTFGLVWYEIENAPIIAPVSVMFETYETLNPYPELEGVVININTATIDELQMLPGIGAAKAKAISNYVKQRGRITDLKQLLNVDGIGEKTLNDIKPFLSIR